jgi:ubiquinone/menaquinone biosynthesis C-methylase UbiE
MHAQRPRCTSHGDYTGVVRETGGQFDDKRLTLADPQNLKWMTDAIAPAPADVVLDVASGTGHLALALAPHVDRVVSFDVTARMQEKASAKVSELGLSNVTFVRGAAEALPFANTTFDLVTCRFAFHHFPDPVWSRNSIGLNCAEK